MFFIFDWKNTLRLPLIQERAAVVMRAPKVTTESLSPAILVSQGLENRVDRDLLKMMGRPSDSPSAFRPIVLLVEISMLFESVVAAHLSDSLEQAIKHRPSV